MMSDRNEHERDFFSDLMFGPPPPSIEESGHYDDRKEEKQPPHHMKEEPQLDLTQIVTLVQKLSPLIELISAFIPNKEEERQQNKNSDIQTNEKNENEVG